tara:strand:- start:6737 stop:7516 length:780 start_codon:yes stop_codon:yes gene_type:complete
MTLLISKDTASPEDLLASFPMSLNAVVIGAQGGIGAAVTKALVDAPRVGRVLALSRRPGQASGKVETGLLDLEDPASIDAAARFAEESFGTVHLIFVASGILHQGAMQPEKSWRALGADNMARAFAVNATGPALVAARFADLLPRDEKVCFAAVSARVGSITDNGFGGWYAYRASKAALNQLIRTFAIELGRKHPRAIALALHPGTTDTALSSPFQANVPNGKLFTPAYSANRMLQVIDAAEPADSGKLIAWDGEVLPY